MEVRTQNNVLRTGNSNPELKQTKVLIHIIEDLRFVFRHIREVNYGLSSTDAQILDYSLLRAEIASCTKLWAQF